MAADWCWSEGLHSFRSIRGHLDVGDFGFFVRQGKNMFRPKGCLRLLGGGFLFSTLPGEMIQFDQYFSDGLKPPTRLYGMDVVNPCCLFPSVDLLFGSVLFGFLWELRPSESQRNDSNGNHQDGDFFLITTLEIRISVEVTRISWCMVQKVKAPPASPWGIFGFLRYGWNQLLVGL